ncbi:MAG: hypothetical protein N4A33_02040 [Bacteriovoracaceae bacterium]|nr:hypothetical protein [Bacteriovoracaceae bacterium]
MNKLLTIMVFTTFSLLAQDALQMQQSSSQQLQAGATFQLSSDLSTAIQTYSLDAVQVSGLSYQFDTVEPVSAADDTTQTMTEMLAGFNSFNAQNQKVKIRVANCNNGSSVDLLPTEAAGRAYTFCSANGGIKNITREERTISTAVANIEASVAADTSAPTISQGFATSTFAVQPMNADTAQVTTLNNQELSYIQAYAQTATQQQMQAQQMTLSP